MRWLRPTLFLLLAPLVASCDGAGLLSPDGSLVENAFTIRVDGGEPETRRGAYFGYYETDRGGTFAVLLGGDPATQARALTHPVAGFLRDGPPAEPGTYALAAVEPQAGPPAGTFTGFYLDPDQYVIGEMPAQSGLYYSGRGTLTVDEVDGDRARGTFEMWVVEFGANLVPDGEGVTLRGEFHAVLSDAVGAEGGLLARRAASAWPDWLPL